MDVVYLSFWMASSYLIVVFRPHTVSFDFVLFRILPYGASLWILYSKVVYDNLTVLRIRGLSDALISVACAVHAFLVISTITQFIVL